MGTNNKKMGSMEEAKAMFGSQNLVGGAGVRVDTVQDGATMSIDAVVTEVIILKDRPAFVNVFLPNGSYLTNVAWSGGYIDPATKNLHGDYIPPVIGQKVMVAFSDGDVRAPYVSALIFRGALSDEADLYVDYANKSNIKKDSVLRSHRTGGRQHFYTDAIETGYEGKANQKITKSEINTGFTDKANQKITESSVVTTGDGTKNSQILQDDSGVKLGAGGPSGYKAVAVVDDNYVLTALGLQPILPAPARVGPTEQVVKA